MNMRSLSQLLLYFNSSVVLFQTCSCWQINLHQRRQQQQRPQLLPQQQQLRGDTYHFSYSHVQQLNMRTRGILSKMASDDDTKNAHDSIDQSESFMRQDDNDIGRDDKELNEQEMKDFYETPPPFSPSRTAKRPRKRKNNGTLDGEAFVIPDSTKVIKKNDTVKLFQQQSSRSNSMDSNFLDKNRVKEHDTRGSSGRRKLTITLDETVKTVNEASVNVTKTVPRKKRVRIPKHQNVFMKNTSDKDYIRSKKNNDVMELRNKTTSILTSVVKRRGGKLVALRPNQTKIMVRVVTPIQLESEIELKELLVSKKVMKKKKVETKTIVKAVKVNKTASILTSLVKKRGGGLVALRPNQTKIMVRVLTPIQLESEVKMEEPLMSKKMMTRKKVETKAKTKVKAVKVKTNGMKIEKKRIIKQKKKQISSSAPKTVVASTKIKTENVKTKPAMLYSSDVARINPQNEWIDLKIPPYELRPSVTLTTGQCFNWVVVRRDESDYCDGINDHVKNHVALDTNMTAITTTTDSAWGRNDETEWVGPLEKFVISIRETPSTTLYRILVEPSLSSLSKSSKSNNNDEDTIRTYLLKYFQLEVPLKPLYKMWSKHDVEVNDNNTRLSKIASVIPGVRICRQDPIECVFSFICSSNNNIPRITKILSSIRQMYGTELVSIPIRTREEKQSGVKNNDKHNNDNHYDNPCLPVVKIYSFPTLYDMMNVTEEEFRTLGLGYRAKYIIQTRDLLLQAGGKDYLLDLRNQPMGEKYDIYVQQELLKLSGVGRKVADCISLFSLDRSESIPVDVHVQRIASRDYDPNIMGDTKSITPTIYKRVGDIFRDRFIHHAGWAHSLLFAAELPSLHSRLPKEIIDEMIEVSL